MTWHRAEFIAFDTETTGFGPDARIIEVGVVRMREGEVIDRWSQLICPDDVDWDSPNVQKALEVNKIKREELNDKPTFQEVAIDLLDRLSYPYLVAHNTPFDLRMLTQELTRMDMTLPTWDLVLDTCSLDFRVSGGRGFKLENCARRWGVSFKDAHRAEVDAEVCGKIFWAMHVKQELPFDKEQMRAFQANATVAWEKNRNR